MNQNYYYIGYLGLTTKRVGTILLRPRRITKERVSQNVIKTLEPLVQAGEVIISMNIVEVGKKMEIALRNMSITSAEVKFQATPVEVAVETKATPVEIPVEAPKEVIAPVEETPVETTVEETTVAEIKKTIEIADMESKQEEVAPDTEVVKKDKKKKK